ncbi:hypothetical protein [Bacillus piscicola]|uniref:hypothetical protein n=1 Tax=Bacillus piscicola TaxID=1632684 RepID=UPI001F08D081|nr:hypothetical protein [Bacillus piscicola]
MSEYIDYTERLTEEEIKELKEKYGIFWEDSLPGYFGSSMPNDITAFYTRRELDEELSFLNHQMSRNAVLQIYLHERYEKVMKWIDNDKQHHGDNFKNDKLNKLDSPPFKCEAKWEEGCLVVQANHLLPRMKKVFTLPEYQTLRDYYIPRMTESFLNVKPNVPMENSLIYIQQNIPNNLQFDIDNRFRSFLLDSLIRGGIIKDDDINNVMLFEKSVRRKVEDKTVIYVVPKNSAKEFLQKLDL